MAKGKVQGSPPSSGGSRAAKKRRKQKHKVGTESAAQTADKASLGEHVPPSKTQPKITERVVGQQPAGGKSSTATNTTSALDAREAGSKRKRVDSTTPPSSLSAEAAKVKHPPSARDGETDTTATSGGSGSGAGSGSGSGRRGKTGGREQSAPPPSVIDASAADDRSRLLLELDAHGVLSDPDVESGLKARQLLQWMVAPLPVEEFYDSYWEKNAFVVRGRSDDYFSGWLETSDIEAFISGQSMQYGTDLDVTNYVNKRRITLNPPPPGGAQGGKPSGGRKGAAAGSSAGGEGDGGSKADAGGAGVSAAAAAAAVVTPKFVWEKFRQGCSLRMPCPQKYSDPLHRLLSALEEEFGCMVGSNVYLTPPRSQGFAPHWDDIEAFLLQVEGRKRWRVYPPAEEDAALPRLSSPNLTDEQVGEPALEVVLEPGDLLYFPRGWAHQAETVGDEASLHITVSAMQGNCWADLIEGLVPQAVASAVQANRGLRSGLPRSYLEYMGVVHSDETEDKRREIFKKRVKEHLGVIVEEALELLDAAADQMGKRYVSDRLPPVLEEAEEAASTMGRGDAPITPLTRLRLARRGCARLVLEDGVAVVYHCMDNSRVHHGNALSPLQFELDDAPAIEVLLSAYPHPVSVSDLPHPPTEDLEDKVGIATALFKEGFLLVVEDEDDGDASSDDKGTGAAGAGAGAGSTPPLGEEEEEEEEEDGL